MNLGDKMTKEKLSLMKRCFPVAYRRFKIEASTDSILKLTNACIDMLESIKIQESIPKRIRDDINARPVSIENIRAELIDASGELIEVCFGKRLDTMDFHKKNMCIRCGNDTHGSRTAKLVRFTGNLSIYSADKCEISICRICDEDLSKKANGYFLFRCLVARVIEIIEATKPVYATTTRRIDYIELFHGCDVLRSKSK